MKFALAILAFAGLAFLAQADLNSDMKGFVDLVPWAEIAQIKVDMAQTDPEFAATDAFIHSDRMDELVLQLDTSPAFIAYFDFLEANAIPGYTWLNVVRGYFGWPPYPGKFELKEVEKLTHERVLREAPGSRDYSNDFILAAVQTIDLVAWYAHWDDLRANSQEWNDMLTVYRSPEYQEVRTALTNDAIFIEVNTELVANGFQLGVILDNIFGYFYCNYPGIVCPPPAFRKLH